MISEKGKLESTFIEITLPNKKNIIIGCVYRHPRFDIRTFLDKYLNPILAKIDKEHKCCFLVGDFNLDLLQINSSPVISEYFNTLCSYSYLPCILQPTRISKD